MLLKDQERDQKITSYSGTYDPGLPVPAQY
jgi:hypothetical protein